jgi:hypothetical protein
VQREAVHRRRGVPVELHKEPGACAQRTTSCCSDVDELPLFRDEVLPRLERMGVRQLI